MGGDVDHLIGWFKTGDLKPLGIDLVKDYQDKLRKIHVMLLASQSRQNKYEDHKVRDRHFNPVEIFFLKYHE